MPLKINTLIIDATTPKNIYIGLSNDNDLPGVHFFKSMDGGETWSHNLNMPSPIHALALDPLTPSVSIKFE